MLTQHFLSARSPRSIRFHEGPSASSTAPMRSGCPCGAARPGTLGIVWQGSRRHGLDRSATSSSARVERRQAKRLVMKGFEGFRRPALPPERVPPTSPPCSTSSAAATGHRPLTEETSKRGPRSSPGQGSRRWSRTCLLRLRGVGTRLKRDGLTVVKQRGSGYADSIRELVIGNRGMELAESSQSAEHILARRAARRMPFPPRSLRGPSSPGEATERPRLLLVDDRLRHARGRRMVLERQGFAVKLGRR